MSHSSQLKLFECTAPCSSCPYRLDSPRQLWAVEEFEDLLEKDEQTFGAVYMCHKQNGSACIGFLMDQDRRFFPALALRMAFIQNGITRDYLDRLHCPSGLFGSIQEMAAANYPERFDECE